MIGYIIRDRKNPEAHLDKDFNLYLYYTPVYQSFDSANVMYEKYKIYCKNKLNGAVPDMEILKISYENV